MPREENIDFLNPIERLKELKLELQEQGWKIDKILKYIEEHRNQYKGSIPVWNERQIHFLYLDLQGQYSTNEAIEEVSKYHHMNRKDAKSERSKGLFSAFKSINQVRIQEIGKMMYNQKFAWGLVSKICKKLNYFDEEKAFPLEASTLNDINYYIDTNDNYSEEEKRFLKKAINKL